ncbi:PAS domain-containing hybrid sensor histidine kinase/response regulator [Inhella gelatinilytica]|uniref:Virulence sensor protein BvgS n=1 Tax=Inhella gelatinilytica TaxID=2795030 RepID=A0A931NCW7_9BURK|nr:PAS domain S-box protein [Inhella gelatinilytica]MBH9551974.1 PAS domain S-box protein [Inhella gelatinilytica]
MHNADSISKGWRLRLREASADLRYAWVASLVILALALFGIYQALVYAEDAAKIELQIERVNKRVQVERWIAERLIDLKNLSESVNAILRHDAHCRSGENECDQHISDLVDIFKSTGRFQVITLQASHEDIGHAAWPRGLPALDGEALKRIHNLRSGAGEAIGFFENGSGKACLVLVQRLERWDLGFLLAAIEPSAALRPVLQSNNETQGALLRLTPDRILRISASDAPDDSLVFGHRPLPPQSVLDHFLSGKARAGEPFRALDKNNKPILAYSDAVLRTDWWIGVWKTYEDILPTAFPAMLAVVLVAFFALAGIWFLLIFQKQRLRLQASRDLSNERQERLRAVELLRNMAEHSDDIIFVKDKELRYVLFNPAAQRRSSQPLASVLGQRDRDILPPDQAVIFEAHDEEVFKTGAPVARELQVQEGEPRTLSIVKSPLKDEHGNIYGLVGIARDITEAKLAEARLRASEAEFRALFDASSVSFFIQDLETGAPLAVNQQLLRETGCTCMEELETCFAEAPFSKEDMLRELNGLREAWVAGIQDVNKRLEWRGARLDGSEYWQDLQLKVIIWRGRPCLLGASFNVDERKRFEQELLKLSLALEQSPISVIITDTQSVITYVNGAFVDASGYTREEAVGSRARLIASGQTPAAVYVDMWRTLRRGESWSGQIVNRRKSGKFYTDQVSIYPLRQANGVVTHYVGLQKDVTEQISLQQELDKHRSDLESLVVKRTLDLEAATARAEQANASKSSFLANMSHEIRTPMSAVLGSTGLILRDLRALENLVSREALEPIVRRVRQVEDSGRHLLALLNDLLDLSKIEANKLQLSFSDFELRPLVNQLTDMVSEKVAANEIQLVIDLDEAPAVLHGDAMRVSQILLNLLSNAIRFTRRGAVTVRAKALRSHPPSIRFEVQDQGIGISEEHQARLFQAFHQAETTTAHRFGGTGLGLAITKRLAELMGGSVGVRSRVGEGSCFWVELPFEAARAAPPPAPALQADIALQRLQKMGARHILLVDDMEINREIAHDLLIEAGLRVTTAEDGEQALELCRHQAFDLILMDMRMPKLGGIEATKMIRELPLHAQTPVIALTAQAFDEDREACVQAGMNDHVSKPILPEHLFATLLRWLHPVATSTPQVPRPAESTTTPAIPTSHSELPQALLDLKGFDLSIAQRLLGKRLGRLPTLLARFGREQADAAERIDNALGQGEHELALRTAHSLKGTSASLGLRAISELAAKVEFAIGANQSPDLQALRTQLSADTAVLSSLDQ